ncbi:ABC transporter substrate-binding protein [Actinoplanes sp. TRM 88003]|uniref:ABC transporter substrate-binding protein n=1 Tax=Paractinoplanes aksuensis TaxID=2939490 RepID=A0ABT1E3U5_9ACTN|nr:ABC transporter substrate-binding protein [Actinoplanes aksuensis]MCO8277799.1 ABC transporter substrate-binding protein [Actinoplanes aksuensis]
MKRFRPVAMAVAILSVVAACGSGSATADPAPASSAADPAPASSAAGFPVDVTNCGRTLHFDGPPTRVVSGWSSSTELLLALGAGDTLVGQYNTSTGTVTGQYADAAARIPVLGENAPGREQLLAARPQLVWADGEYLFDGKQLPTIADLAEQGVQVMVLSGFCGDDATRAKVLDVDTDLDALGRILGRPADAQRLRADLDRRLDAVAERVGDQPATPVAFLSTFDRQLYTYEGVYSDMARLAGATNVYAGVLPEKSYYGQVSVEDVTRRNPGTLVYLLRAGESEATARTQLTKTLPTVAAIRDNRIVYLPQNDSTNLAGVAGVEKLVAGLHS